MIWKMPQLVAETKLSKGTIYRLIRESDFPKPLKLTGKASGWDAQEVRNWIEGRKAARQG